MSIHVVVTHNRRRIAAATLALGLPLSGLALDGVPPESLSVKIFADRYVVAGKPFSDIAALEAWAAPNRTRVLRLDSCGPASTEHLLAAVERFHKVYVEGIQIRSFAAGEPACVGSVEQASSSLNSASEIQTGLPYYPSDKSGRSLVP
ncbi:MAG TPA: hypothetical protein VE421_04935 [Burkholderiaceae bacterium]|nr:hypothetical protein [Burkholderiaceae bacterium]